MWVRVAVVVAESRVTVIVGRFLTPVAEDGSDALPVAPDARGPHVAGPLRGRLGPLVNDVPDSPWDHHGHERVSCGLQGYGGNSQTLGRTTS